MVWAFGGVWVGVVTPGAGQGSDDLRLRRSFLIFESLSKDNFVSWVLDVTRVSRTTFSFVMAAAMMSSWWLSVEVLVVHERRCW